jgi:acetyl/propionyl-CoA carboxylase alpha subunit
MTFVVKLDGVTHSVDIVARSPRLVLRVDGCDYDVVEPSSDESTRTITVSGRSVSFVRASGGGRQFLRLCGRTFEADLGDTLSQSGAGGETHDHIRAPMPGSVVQVHKHPGEDVARGEPIVTIESMKLQITLIAARDGRLASLTHDVGQTFNKDAIVAELEPLA